MPNHPWRHQYQPDVIIGHMAKGLEIPEDGWNRREFARQGRLLIRAIDRLAKITQRKAAPYVAKIARELFRLQLNEVIRRATSRSRSNRSAKHSGTLIELIFPGDGDIWTQALNEVFAEANLDAVAKLQPPIESVMSDGYQGTEILLGMEDSNRREVARAIARDSREIAGRIVGINDTTLDQFDRHIRGAIEEGLTVTETADKLRVEMDDIFRGRVNTIVRTELNNAWTQGSVRAFQESESVTHVSVIGCEAREPNSPTYKGQSTCNIEDVPVADADKLEFHPNHTGTLIPSRFRE